MTRELCPHLVLGGDGQCGGGVDGLQNRQLDVLSHAVKGVDVKGSQVQ